MSAMAISEPTSTEAHAAAAAVAAVADPAAGLEPGPVTVYEVPEEDWQIWRDLRLEALADAPYAFGETLAAVKERSEEDWRSWWHGPGTIGPRFIALVDGAPAAMCSICFPEFHGTEPLLISMWASPEVRGRGVSRAMLDACVAYCARTGRPRLLLGVVEDNHSARRLYDRYGFTATGGSEPLFSDPTKLVLWMEKPTAQGPAEA
jgi:GNAT superfamily N-acetyltransferase